MKIDKKNNLVNSNTNNTINDDENEIYKPFDDEIISKGLKWRIGIVFIYY